MTPPITRRGFLGGSLILAAGVACGRKDDASTSPPESRSPAEATPRPEPAADPPATPAPDRPALEPESKPLIVDVAGSDPAANVLAALAALGGIEKFVSPGDTVVLKANAAFANPPEWATTTNPQLVAAVARACSAARARRILLLEHPGGGRGKKVVDRNGIGKALEGITGVEIEILGSNSAFREVTVTDGAQLKKVAIAEALLAADVFINLPIAKAHRATKISFGMKNGMGLIRDRRVFHSPLDLDTAIADLARVLKPQLTILDGHQVLLNRGPGGPGDTAAPNRVIAGRDMIAVDAYGLTLAKFAGKDLTPDDVPHILLAARAGLGEADTARVEVKKLKA